MQTSERYWCCSAFEYEFSRHNRLHLQQGACNERNNERESSSLLFVLPESLAVVIVADTMEPFLSIHNKYALCLQSFCQGHCRPCSGGAERLQWWAATQRILFNSVVMSEMAKAQLTERGEQEKRKVWEQLQDRLERINKTDRRHAAMGKVTEDSQSMEEWKVMKEQDGRTRTGTSTDDSGGKGRKLGCYVSYA